MTKTKYLQKYKKSSGFGTEKSDNKNRILRICVLFYLAYSIRNQKNLLPVLKISRKKITVLIEKIICYKKVFCLCNDPNFKKKSGFGVKI